MGSRASLAWVIVAGCAAAAFAASVTAQDVKQDPFELSARSAAEFREQADDLRDEMASGRYAELKTEDKAIVESQRVRLESIHDKHERRERVDTLPHGIAVINASEIINGVLADDKDDRMVCEQVKKAGSNRMDKYCATVRERRLNALGAQKEIRRWYVPRGGCEASGNRCLGSAEIRRQRSN